MGPYCQICTIGQSTFPGTGSQQSDIGEPGPHRQPFCGYDGLPLDGSIGRHAQFHGGTPDAPSILAHLSCMLPLIGPL